MSSAIKLSAHSKGGQGGLPTAASTSHAILLEKLNRRSTPDSEALASSDDEVDPLRQDPAFTSVQSQKPIRRTSWLQDTSVAAIRPRKESFASSSMSPTASHPSTPSAEIGAANWGTHTAANNVLGRSHSGTGSFNWGTAIWNSDRKDAQSRLAEVLPSPTSTTGSNPFPVGDGAPLRTSPAPRDPGTNPQIPFAIPLHPTPKTYRSQSYSVGQLDPDSTSPMTGSTTLATARSRPIGHPGLQHRPSRPSMLSEMSNDGTMLGNVKEVDDDEETADDSAQDVQQQSADAKTIEMLTRENALLRQHANQQYRLRARASTASVYSLGNGYSLHDALPEESDYAVDELDDANDLNDLANKRANARRMSEYGGVGAFRTPFSVENRKLENVKKAYWQSSLGFGGIGDVSQSRRHSFADVPTRQGSISSVGEAAFTHEPASMEQGQAYDYTTPYADSHNFAANAAHSYLANSAGGILGSQQLALGSLYANPYASLYGMQPTGFSNRPGSPHRSMFGMTQPSRSTPLHVVLFKCARADVFYIQEGTGLIVKPGDLVIVEADRGTDLGTVAVQGCDWNEAKHHKEHYAEEQYKWLMMYSQNAGVTQEGVGAGLMAASSGLQGSAVGGMGPQAQHHAQEQSSAELKPKLIKRLAQNHEIQSLREKEGNEAKAKRVCMQKVKEHGLNMEILDAEFQMDWKKLTFYYFADSYINFNSLVTDLFKIYKTRIWMSAINPASFASQPLGLQAPSGVGPGAVGVSRNAGLSERRPSQVQDSQTSAMPSAMQSMRNFQPGAAAPQASMGGAYATSDFPFSPYAAFGAVPRAPEASFVPNMMSQQETYATGFPPTNDYASMRNRFPTPQSATSPHDQAISPLSSPPPDWTQAFQGLSLNGR